MGKELSPEARAKLIKFLARVIPKYEAEQRAKALEMEKTKMQNESYLKTNR